LSPNRYCLQIARQPNEKKMLEALERIIRAAYARRSRRERLDEKAAGPRPQPFIFNFQPEQRSFSPADQFRKSNVSRQELIVTLREILDALEHDEGEREQHDRSNPAVA
jgi:lysyl-tRNA synthetase class I